MNNPKIMSPLEEKSGAITPTSLMDFTHYQSQSGIIKRVSTETRNDVSIVIPLFNEVENIDLLYAGLKPVVDSLDKSCEIIFIDDGSEDGTYAALRRIQANDPRVWIIRLRRNFGQTAAFSAGFDLARGDIIITMDGDLQNDPLDIPKLLDKINEGNDVVSGWRINRQDVFLTRRFPSIIANALISKVTGVRLHDYGCSLKAYRREVVKNIKLYGEMHRFIPALAKWIGIQVAEVPVSHHPRRFGRSKYGLQRTVKVILDLLTVKFLLDYATRPIQIFGLMGLLSLFSGTALGVYLSYQRIFLGLGLRDRPVLLLAILLTVLGVQLVTMGLLGELVVRTYHESQNKPIYVVREVLGNKTTIEEASRAEDY
jgi:glycosyltransferase involved in cell wall biosynthesis